MTTITLAPATPAPLPQVDLETRLAIVGAAMDVLLAEASAQFAIRTAHIDIDPVPDIADIIDALPLTPTLTPVLAPPACPYATPVAATLWRARHRIEADGWCRGARRDEAGARCLDGAIRVEASSPNEAVDALVLLLEAIQRDFRDAESVPSWNDAQASQRPVLLALDRAAQLADARGL